MDRNQGHVAGGVRALLRLEGLALLCAALALYFVVHGDWLLFLKLFLLPDLSFALYLFGTRAGGLAYNAAHSTIGPLAAAAFGCIAARPIMICVALIWLAHIGGDRALGYGLKYASAFGDTHLGTKKSRATPHPSTSSG